MSAMLGLFGVGVGLGVRELLLMNDWIGNKRKYFDLAETASQRLGKPLLVVGRPRGRDHGVGDICIDLDGCPEYPEKGVKGDVRDMGMFPNKRFGAVFVGSVLEALPSGVDQAVHELYRVADEVYIQHIFDSSLSSRYHPETKTIVHAAPPVTPWVEYAYQNDGVRRVAFPYADGLSGVNLSDAVREAAKITANLMVAQNLPEDIAVRVAVDAVLISCGRK